MPSFISFTSSELSCILIIRETLDKQIMFVGMDSIDAACDLLGSTNSIK